MLRLKANKTSLYKLVSCYENLPPMRGTEFKKAFRAPDFWLKWTDGTLWCEAFLAACGGSPLLSITKKECGGPQVSRNVHQLSSQELQEHGMVEKVTTAAERREEGAAQPMNCALCLPCFLEMKKAGTHDISCTARGVNMKITCWKCQRRRYGAEYEVSPLKKAKA